MTTSGPYLRALAATSYLLEQHGRLDEHALARIKAISEEETMEHAVKAATVTVADLGEFTAIAAAWTVDRDNDQIIRGAFARSIQRWRASGKRIPLHWNHRGEAHNIIGSIDSPSVREIDEGLYVEGKPDLEDSATAREAWRAMKSNSMSLSFGYVTTKNRRRNDGVNELLELDLIVVSIVPAPSNPDTRIIATKSFDGDREFERIKRRAYDDTSAVLAAADNERLRTRAAEVAREFAPVQVARFEV